MAPTGILAEQHYQNLLKLLEAFTFPESGLNLTPGNTALLSGGTSETEKRRITDALQSGEIRLVIGTHTILEDPIQFLQPTLR